jgi:guanine deaminase
VDDWRGHLILPGFIDIHAHAPQVDVIARHGTQLLDWLNRYTFPEERKFADTAHAAQTSAFFLDQLLENGTTTALVFCTVHPTSANEFFAAAETRGLRMIAGKSVMDRHAPDFLCDTAERAYSESKALIERWHGHARLAYAITPRFAPTSTPAQLAACGRLAREHPDVYIQSHVAENRDEVRWARELFPEARSYLDVYERAGLLRDRAVYAHCIWLDDEDRKRMQVTGTAAAFCPTSNLFLGSGLYDLQRADAAGVMTGLATDIGGGTSYSMLASLGEAYKIAQLQGHSMSAAEMLYLATLAGARALRLEDRIGSFERGREADVVVLNPQATPLLKRRANVAGADALDQFFALTQLGDERAVAAVYLMGERRKA